MFLRRRAAEVCEVPQDAPSRLGRADLEVRHGFLSVRRRTRATHFWLPYSAGLAYLLPFTLGSWRGCGALWSDVTLNATQLAVGLLRNL